MPSICTSLIDAASPRASETRRLPILKRVARNASAVSFAAPLPGWAAKRKCSEPSGRHPANSVRAARGETFSARRAQATAAGTYITMLSTVTVSCPAVCTSTIATIAVKSNIPVAGIRFRIGAITGSVTSCKNLTAG